MVEAIDLGGLPAEFDPNAVATVEMTEDGGAIVDLEGAAKTALPPVDANDFEANLADFLLDDTARNLMASDIITIVNEDEESRKDWVESYARGLKLLGLKYEQRTKPWAGACGAFHPMLLESVIRFQSEAMAAIFPASGPVKTAIIGRFTPEKEKQGQRVARDMNYVLLEKMKGYRDETETMLFNLPIAGTTFRKKTFNRRKKRPNSDYILPEHIIMPYHATSLETSDRFTHVLIKTRKWFETQVRTQFYRDENVSEMEIPSDAATNEKDKIEGKTSVATGRTGNRLKFYECHIELMIEEDPLKDPDGHPSPYVVTVDSASQKLLAIRRNWKKEDLVRDRVVSVIQHKYMPGFGAYGLGLINILGGLSETATSILRQLIDAGTLSNLPSGYKSKNLRVKNDNTPHAPGEFRDAEVTSGTLRDAIVPLPVKEPSQVLYSLLGNVVDEGRRIGSVADMKISDMNGQNMPVGTTLAIIERTMKVMSAVMKRLHESFKQEFKVLAELINSYMPAEYEFDLSDEEQAQGVSRATDYDARIDILPVSDPEATTMAHRIMVNQAIIQLSQGNPNLYDQRELHRSMINALGSEEADRFIPPLEDVKPRDPVTENMDLMNSRPVRAGISQDHESHIKVHMAAIEDPQIQAMMANNPLAPAIMAAAAAHLQEHLAFKYRADLEDMLGVPLPPPDEPLPEDVEFELSRMVALASDKLIGKHRAEDQEKEILDNLQDPIIQNETRKLDLQEKQMQDRREIDEAKIALEAMKIEQNKVLTEMKEMSETFRTFIATQVQTRQIASEAQVEQAKTSAGLVADLAKVEATRTRGAQQ